MDNKTPKKRFEELKTQRSNTIPDPCQPFYAMCDASNFRSEQHY